MKNSVGPIYDLPNGVRFQLSHETRAAFGPSTSGLRFASHIARTVPVCKDSMTRVLDVGCGSGILSLVCAAKGFEVYAVDVLAEACEATKAEFLRNDLPYAYVGCEGLGGVDEGKRFDLIFCNPPLMPNLSDPSGLDLPISLIERLPNLLRGSSARAQIYLTDNLDVAAVLATARHVGLRFHEVWSACICINRQEFWPKYEDKVSTMDLKKRAKKLFLRGTCFEFSIRST